MRAGFESVTMALRVDIASWLGRAGVLVTAVAVLAGAPVWAQSLGAVARETEAKRKTTKAAGKVYTNDQLRSEPTPTQTPPAAGTEAPAPSQPGANAESKEATSERAKDEAHWRDRAKTARDALARAETFEAALQSQINGLYAEFSACQAPPQCSEVSAKRQKSLAELDRVKKEVAQHKKGITDLQEEARRAGVPAGWVR